MSDTIILIEIIEMFNYAKTAAKFECIDKKKVINSN